MVVDILQACEVNLSGLTGPIQSLMSALVNHSKQNSERVLNLGFVPRFFPPVLGALALPARPSSVMTRSGALWCGQGC